MKALETDPANQELNALLMNFLFTKINIGNLLELELPDLHKRLLNILHIGAIEILTPPRGKCPILKKSHELILFV